MRPLTLALALVLTVGTQATWFNLPSIALRETNHWLNFDKLPAPKFDNPKEDKWAEETSLDSEEEYVAEESEERSEKKWPSMIDDFEFLDREGEVVIFRDEDEQEQQSNEREDTMLLKEVWEDVKVSKSKKEWMTEKKEETPRMTRIGGLKKSGKVFKHKTYNRDWEHHAFDFNALPKAWDWRNVSGVNYCAPTRNQHIPVYCGSCWVFGTTGMLNDRFNIARKNRWPMTMVSPQEIIDCGGKGNCQGGEVGDVLEYAKTHGLVEEGCNVYRATNGECTPYHRCGSCWPNNCFALNNYTRHYVKDYAPVKGLDNIKAEIKARGPIACSIGATKKFEYEYVNGVYREKSDLESNHIITLSGWGVETDGTEYWIARNSWGEEWGEKGWFRVVTSAFNNATGNDWNMGIEKDCTFADVDVSNMD